MSDVRHAPQQPAGSGGDMSNGDADDSADDAALSESDVFEFVAELGHANHFTRWLAIMRLENEDAHPINSSTIQRRLFEMTGEWPQRRSVLTSMRRLKKVDVLGKEEVDGLDRHHWYVTEYGREMGREIIVLWNEALDCAEAAEVLRASGDAESSSDGEDDEDGESTD